MKESIYSQMEIKWEKIPTLFWRIKKIDDKVYNIHYNNTYKKKGRINNG